jgi:hypothetical protein
MSDPYMAQPRLLANRRPLQPLSLTSIIGFPFAEVAREQGIPLGIEHDHPFDRVDSAEGRS